MIVKANACYTGGGIYRFTGQLNDKRFVLGNSEWDELYITDEDPDTTEESWYNEWCDEHIVETVKDSAYATLMNELIKWILENRPDGNYQASEIEKFICKTTIEFVTEDGHTDETEFDTWNKDELAKLWYEFCIENGIIVDVNNI